MQANNYGDKTTCRPNLICRRKRRSRSYRAVGVRRRSRTEWRSWPSRLASIARRHLDQFYALFAADTIFGKGQVRAPRGAKGFPATIHDARIPEPCARADLSPGTEACGQTPLRALTGRRRRDHGQAASSLESESPGLIRDSSPPEKSDRCLTTPAGALADIGRCRTVCKQPLVRACP